ncbi:hypothetical protein Tbis_0927 [Thermobispora bispora DSM 43833]|uniref:DUF3039 domain-containing protein n=1 Tax=Thermobispora bispora (strain ATCC 19993 / DSM 43833 / CBS 139.67 / JCM 10125 / KCTC 9307 / NBRC 14880 / R51) TaxID=469371 RepID=D6Y756_THEBD|nr:hypothetical protein Tbis_0927 [Thermobispora bispora DSM 43833]
MRKPYGPVLRCRWIDSLSVSGTKILPESEVRPRLSHGDGDHERFAHYADKNKITQSYVTGTPVRALCGKVWVPSRDPKKYPICPECKEIYDGLPKGEPSGE